MRTRLPAIAKLALLIGLTSVNAQQSASFQVREQAFNNGGDPRGGVVLSSVGFRLTLDALGQPVAGLVLSGSSLSLEGGLVAELAPPGEVRNLRFNDSTTLVWDVEHTAQNYAMYEGMVPVANDPGYGVCKRPPPPITTESVPVTTSPGPGQIRFYLITARNGLGEEGTKGYTSAGAERANLQPCP